MREKSAFQNAEVPMKTLSDGRDFISDQDIHDDPCLQNFIDRFPDYWRRDWQRCGWASRHVSKA